MNKERRGIVKLLFTVVRYYSGHGVKSMWCLLLAPAAVGNCRLPSYTETKLKIILKNYNFYFI